MHITSSELTVERFWRQNKMLKICLCKYLNAQRKPGMLKIIFNVVPLASKDSSSPSRDSMNGTLASFLKLLSPPPPNSHNNPLYNNEY